MQVTLSVRDDQEAAGGYILRDPGDSLVIGRAYDCNVRIDNPRLSYYHFKLVLEAGACHFIDLSSVNGTQINGSPAMDKYLQGGDLIEAGGVRFHIRISEAPATESNSQFITGENSENIECMNDSVAEGGFTAATPIAIFESIAPQSLPPHGAGEPPSGSLLESSLNDVDKNGDTKLYAIVDGAQSMNMVFLARMMGHKVYTLFTGEMAERVSHAGPCLIGLESPKGFLEEWNREAGKNLGVLLRTGSDLNSLYLHLRHIFVITDEQEEEYYFRYYDPRVIRTYLPTCTDSEIGEFFGPITHWIVENEDGTSYRVWYRSSARLTSHLIGQGGAAEGTR